MSSVMLPPYSPMKRLVNVQESDVSFLRSILIFGELLRMHYMYQQHAHETVGIIDREVSYSPTQNFTELLRLEI